MTARDEFWACELQVPRLHLARCCSRFIRTATHADWDMKECSGPALVLAVTITQWKAPYRCQNLCNKSNVTSLALAFPWSI